MLQVSIIIPVYNASSFIEETAKGLLDYLKSSGLSHEIIFVNDGSPDDTAQVLNKLSEGSAIKVINLPTNQGKFGAIKAGMQIATGQCCIFTDADLPYDLSAISYCYETINTGAIHLVVGDRRLPQSQSIVPTTYLRKFASFTLATIIRLLMTGGLHDSQCGFKAFRNDVAKAVFPMIRFTRFAGDIEVLYIALKYNLTIKRIPVKLVNSAPTTVRLQLDFIGFLHCIFSMRINWDLGRYKSPALEQEGARVYWE